MAWDNNAKQLAVKVIGTVESNLKWDAINYNDPITTGIMQWYGVRACNVLNRMKTTNPNTFSNVNSSILNDLSNIPSSNSSFWNNRELTKAEGESLKPMLRHITNQRVQVAQAYEDLDDYAAVARRWGMDIENNTQAFIFFCCMYHQAPARTREVLNAAGTNSGIDRLYSFTMNNSVLKIYKTRYTTARDLIKAGDASGVPTPDGSGGESDPVDPVDPSTPGGDAGSPDNGSTPPNVGGTRKGGDISSIDVVGNSLMVNFKDGHKLWAYPATANRFIVSYDGTQGVEVPPENPSPPDETPAPPDSPPPPSGATGKAARILQFLESKVDAYRYSQNMAGRLNPEASGYCDCSGLMYYVFKRFAGITLGTYTGAQYTQGTRVMTGTSPTSPDESKLLPGDLIFFNWHNMGRNTVDHVEMYYGNGKTIGHGGPDNGPDIQNLKAMVAARPNNWYVQRFNIQ